jgi:1-aminocyclopropane-1-carboxylate deaminase/D-cysteine desulfhydrase-like pyridoxal-dependent ACC family enzyme
LYIDDKRRPIEDQSPLYEFEETLKRDGRKTYLVPNGASEHPLGGLGYMACAAEIAIQAFGLLGKQFDHIVHCTGSSSTQAGLLAGFAAMGLPTKITGIADDGETEIKRQRIHRLANDTLAEMKIAAEVPVSAVEVVAARDSAYGESDPEVFDVIHRFARAEGLVVDPVYEGSAVLGLLTLGKAGSFGSDSNVLLMHLGGSPAVHAYSDVFGTPELVAWPKVP